MTIANDMLTLYANFKFISHIVYNKKHSTGKSCPREGEGFRIYGEFSEGGKISGGDFFSFGGRGDIPWRGESVL